MLDQATPPHVIDVGSKLAHGHRPHIPGAMLLDLDEIDSAPTSSRRPRHRALLRVPERGVGAPRRADPARARLQARASARRRHRRLDRLGSRGRPPDHEGRDREIGARAAA
jgi:hypothetical protein